MKKSFIFFISLLALGACKKDITTQNVETKKPASVPAPTLFAYATKSYAEAVTSASVNSNVFRFTTSQWAMVTYQDEAQYDFATRNIPQAWWTDFYTKVIQNLNNAAEIITADALLAPEVKTNQLAIIDIIFRE